MTPSRHESARIYPASGEEAGELSCSDGPGASFDAMEEILRSLLDPNGTVSE